MLRYRLDDLGWYQFEQLTQSLLKAELGLGIQSWGGRGDWGIDVYYKGNINYPTKTEPATGSFVFQVKFVENANASGADSGKAILNAVRAEISKLKKAKHAWIKKLTHYVFITNAPLSSKMRSNITESYNKLFLTAEIHTHNGSDLSDWLDNNPNLRKAFPQLLSIRDIDSLLREVVNNDILTRSKMVIEEAKEINTVFVPTETYSKAWEILKKYKFLVLDGPPEVGKTAIAYVIALTLILDEWDAIYCSNPNDILKMHEPSRKQIFIADDAFGRTDYDPERGRHWEKDLPHILRLLDSAHWLIFTSRKHILERAYRDIDLQDQAKKFPKPAEVIVDATQLSVQEKALMLYRHAKAALLEDVGKAIIKQNAVSIVQNPNFTPERIRRFVSERLLDLSVQFKGHKLDDAMLAKEVTNAINNPTERIRKTYDKLTPSHKWFLASLIAIDRGHHVDIADLEKTYYNYCPPQEGWASFNKLRDELSETFIKIRVLEWAPPPNEYAQWIHPSYRDLVIEKISEDLATVKKLLELATVDLLKLAISDSGGAEGKRQLPLLSSEEQWEIFEKRCCSQILQLESPHDILSILTAIDSKFANASDTTTKTNISNTVKAILIVLIEKWNKSKQAIQSDLLKRFYNLSLIISPLPPSPDLEETWTQSVSRFEEAIANYKNDKVFYADDFEEWIKVIGILDKNEPRLLRQFSFPEAYEKVLGDYIAIANEHATADHLSLACNEFGLNEDEYRSWIDDPESVDIDEDKSNIQKISGQLEETINDYSVIAESMIVLSLHNQSKNETLEEINKLIKSNEDELNHMIAQLEEVTANLTHEPDDYERPSSGQQFDVNQLFIDL